MSLFSSEQLAASAGKSLRTIRHHVKHGWLQPEPKFPGVRGWRFTESAASTWLNRHYPGRTLDPALRRAPQSASAPMEQPHTPGVPAHPEQPRLLAPPHAHVGGSPQHPAELAALPPKPVGTWKQSLHHESAHYIVAGVAACGARVPEGTPWHDHTTGLRRCTRCMPKAL